ncbi:MAG: hypothetical protein JO170_25390 [Verrucomicrobia bacterium]|nr:hypothetical protein [Verrucomicrobiota bacterium]
MVVLLCYVAWVNTFTELIVLSAASPATGQGVEQMADSEALDTTIIANLTDEERRRSAVYLDKNALPAGKTTIGGRQIEVDHPYVMVFIDRNPGANWMHPCRYLLINPHTLQVTSVDSDRPPVFGVLPSSWRLVMRSPGLDDWRIIRIAPLEHGSTS